MDFDEFMKRLDEEEENSDGPACGHSDCDDKEFIETSKIIRKHIMENYTDEEHKNMSPLCFICVTFFIGLTMGEIIARVGNDDM